MGKKTVSVVMCTYNGEKYLREQMDSILAQTYPIHEIIVCDDCSTDGTMNILQEYATKFPFIKVHRNTRNKGCNQIFHDIFYQVSKKVDYIAISDQDDIWFPEKIGKLVQLIEKEEGYNLCFSDIISSPTYSRQQTKDYLPLPFTAESLFFRDNIPGHAMLIKRTFIENLKPWSGMTFYYDWWLAMNAALTDSIIKCKEPLSWHRIHSASVITTVGRKLSKHKPHSPIAPYVYGTYNFFKLRNTESFKCFYNNIYEKTSPTHHPILHQITKLFNSHNPLDLLRLCFVCMKHRKQIYPHPHKGKGSIFALRGFFSPFICTYYNIQFYNTETEHNSQLNKKQK